MKTHFTIALTSALCLGLAPINVSAKTSTTAKAEKSPVQITFELYKSKVKIDKSLWYKLTLKNIGKTKLHVDDLIFKDPWAMAENCRLRYGIYIEVVDENGKPIKVRSGGDRVHYDWEPKRGETLLFTPKERAELDVLEADWKKRGLTEQQQSIAASDWVNELNSKKNQAELSDLSKQLWLAPGTSTATFTWMDRGPGEYEGRAEDDLALKKGYAQLWSYSFSRPGTYRIRAVYDYSMSESTKKLFKKHGRAVNPSRITIKTPFVEFQALP